MTHPAPNPDAGSSHPPRVCLVVIFNHRYEGNLTKLDEIYRHRFQHVRYLMPFYRGERTDVFPAHYSSHQFQGFILEAWRRVRDEGFTHLVFVADDILLNPRLNEGNICAELRLDTTPGSAYLHNPVPVTDITCRWPYLMRALTAIVGNNGTNWEQELPPADRARETLRGRGLAQGRFGWRNVLCRMTMRSFFLVLYYVALMHQWRRSHPGASLREPPYPLVVGYADFFVAPTAVMDALCHLSGVMASMGVFVEVALPTALALVAPIVRERDTAWKAHEDMQHPSQWEPYARKHDFELRSAVAEMGEHELFIHPIKLSRWKI